MIEIDDGDLDARLAEDTMMFSDCPAGHYFSGPLESLTCYGEDKHDPGNAAAVRDLPAEPEPEISRPNTAPAYYLGHPARLWITVMRPPREGRDLRQDAG